jgi:hypothetical protein
VTPGYWETFTTWAFSTVGSGAKYIASSAFTSKSGKTYNLPY